MNFLGLDLVYHNMKGILLPPAVILCYAESHVIIFIGAIAYSGVLNICSGPFVTNF